jgi:hypothetical protein
MTPPQVSSTTLLPIFRIEHDYAEARLAIDEMNQLLLLFLIDDCHCAEGAKIGLVNVVKRS